MPGVSTEEVVTRWEDGRGYSVDIQMKRMPMRGAHADFDITVEDGTTVLTEVRSEIEIRDDLGDRAGSLREQLEDQRERAQWR